jgi:hypothetical protein
MLCMFRNRSKVLMRMRIFGLKRDKLRAAWRKLQIRNLYSLMSLIRVIESRRMMLTGHVTRKGEMRNAYKNLIGKSEKNKALRRPRRR